MKKTKSTESFLSISALSNYEIIKAKLETGEFQTVKLESDYEKLRRHKPGFEAWIHLLLTTPVLNLDLSNIKLNSFRLQDGLVKIWLELLRAKQKIFVQTINLSGNPISSDSTEYLDSKTLSLSSTSLSSCSKTSAITLLMKAILKSSVVYVQLSNCMLTALQCRVVADVIKKYPLHDLKLDLSKNPVYFEASSSGSDNIFTSTGVNCLQNLIHMKSETQFLSFNIFPTFADIITTKDKLDCYLMSNLVFSKPLIWEPRSLLSSTDSLNGVITINQKSYGASDEKQKIKKSEQSVTLFFQRAERAYYKRREEAEAIDTALNMQFPLPITAIIRGYYPPSFSLFTMPKNMTINQNSNHNLSSLA